MMRGGHGGRWGLEGVLLGAIVAEILERRGGGGCKIGRMDFVVYYQG